MDSVLRIIDAGLNRVREGWRVMEDAARFHLDSGDLCERLKSLRHDLARSAREAGLDEALLQSMRNTPGDVGTSITTAAEGRRAGLRDAVIAAGKRAGEALRSIEEAIKVRRSGPTGPTDAPAGAANPGAPFERLRYRHYDLERELVLAMGAARVPPQWRLCVLITESLCRLSWQEVARLAKASGADCLQLREPGLPDAELLVRARELVEIGRTREPVSVFDTDPQAQPGTTAHVIINNRPDIALLAGADGVHLGQCDLPVREARRIVGERLWIGASTHDLTEARGARDAGADYCGVGAMFASSTKQREVSGHGYLQAYLAQPTLARIPHLAIGGITPENAGVLAAAGARGVAVSSAVCASDDPGGVCRALVRAMERVSKC